MERTPPSQQNNQKQGSMASLLLTGDLRGIQYIKKTITELPRNTFNFCCTIDGTANKEADLSSANLRPIKMSQEEQRAIAMERERQHQMY